MLDEELLIIDDGDKQCAVCSQGDQTGIFGRGDLVDPMEDIKSFSSNNGELPK